MINSLFVYGTLMPGEPRWPLLSPLSSGRRPDRIWGRLVDTGHGYPGLLEGTDEVHGWIVDLTEPDVALPRLDAVEGTAQGLYRRQHLTSLSGIPCWTYRYLRTSPRDRDLHGRWSQSAAPADGAQ